MFDHNLDFLKQNLAFSPNFRLLNKISLFEQNTVIIRNYSIIQNQLRSVLRIGSH